MSICTTAGYESTYDQVIGFMDFMFSEKLKSNLWTFQEWSLKYETAISFIIM